MVSPIAPWPERPIPGMEQLRISRSDWSGGELNLTVNRKKMEWEQSDYKFKLVSVDLDSEIADEMEVLNLVGSEWEKPLFSLTRFAGNKDWIAASGDIVREGTDPIAVACQMICNLV